MPLPMMILPVESQVPSNITSAIESALVKSAVIPANETARLVLENNGFTMESALISLGNLTLTARDSVKHSAIKDILDIHGVQFKKDSVADGRPIVTFNVHSESGNVNLNNLFAPER